MSTPRPASLRQLASELHLPNPEALDSDLSGITSGFGGFLRCETCHRTGPVRADYWREGWPKCCGYTMRWWTQRQIDAGEHEATT